MDTQLTIPAFEIDAQPGNKPDKLRKRNGKFATREQRNIEDLVTQALGEEKDIRRNAALWRTIRRLSEKVIQLENQLKKYTK